MFLCMATLNSILTCFTFARQNAGFICSYISYYASLSLSTRVNFRGREILEKYNGQEMCTIQFFNIK